MSQHDLDIANQGFPATRADINNALQALGSSNSGATAPSTTYANQLWYDTANNIIKIRNEDNDAWISLFTLDQTNDNIEALTVNGTVTADALTVDTNTLYVDATNNRVGVGVTDPSQDIDLVGTGNSGSGSVRAGGTGSGTQAAFIVQSQFGSASFGSYGSYPAILNSSNNPVVYFDTNNGGRAVFDEGVTFNGDTAAANALDDYEEGTFTPAFSTASATATAIGRYTKVGRIVTIQIQIRWTQSGTSFGAISGLPFATSTVNNQAVMSKEFYSAGDNFHSSIATGATATANWRKTENNSITAVSGQQYGFAFSFTYHTA